MQCRILEELAAIEFDNSLEIENSNLKVALLLPTLSKIYIKY